MTNFFSYRSLSALLTLLLLASCTSSGIPKRDKASEATDEIDFSYSDDLSKYRPSVEKVETDNETTEVEENEAITSTYDISTKMNGVLDSLISRNNKLASLSGYTLLVYSGNSEVEAGRVRNRLYDIMPDMEAQLQYKLPTYFVKIGQFYQQIEAQPLYEKIKKYYPNATVVPEKFKLEK